MVNRIWDHQSDLSKGEAALSSFTDQEWRHEVKPEWSFQVSTSSGEGGAGPCVEMYGRGLKGDGYKVEQEVQVVLRRRGKKLPTKRILSIMV